MPFQLESTEKIPENGVTSADTSTQKYQNTYRLEPYNPFRPDPVEKIVSSVMMNNLEDIAYDSSVNNSELCMKIAMDIRKRVQKLNFDRYKIVVAVTIIEKTSQSLESLFGCLWDSARDNYVTYSMETQSFFAYACVFAVYYE